MTGGEDVRSQDFEGSAGSFRSLSSFNSGHGAGNVQTSV